MADLGMIESRDVMLLSLFRRRKELDLIIPRLEDKSRRRAGARRPGGLGAGLGRYDAPTSRYRQPR